MTVRIDLSAVKNPASASERQALNPSTVARSKAGPKMIPRAGFAPTATASAALSCGSGKSHG